MTGAAGPDERRHTLLHGRPTPPEGRRTLRAGPVTAALVGPDLRSVRVGDTELVQRIYVAVRDGAWNTIPAELSEVEVEEGSEGFRVRFTARHRFGDIDLEWVGGYTGAADGTIVATMDATANSAFSYAKIGFNLHHALREYVGRAFRARTPDGEVSGVLPEAIAPQEIRDGSLTAMFPFFDELTVDLGDGLEVRFSFDGDSFEMQDHRNWGDGNYKTYGTPLSRGYPMSIEPGARLRQQVTVAFDGQPPARTAPSGPHRLEVGEPLGRVPAVGLGMASHGGGLDDRECELLAALAPAHLRVDLHLGRDEHRAELQRAVEAARCTGAALELAVFLTDRAGDELDRLADALRTTDAAVARVLVVTDAEGFSELRGTTPVEVVRLAKERLDAAIGGAPVVGGTDQFFVEINRDRPDLTAMDGVAYSLNPQVHACDDLSLMENVSCQADRVRFLRSLGDVPIHISPITLIGRTGPFPAGPPPAGDGLPGAVDVRQPSLLGAAWTVGSLSCLMQAGAASATYYETTGWRGVLETAAGSPEGFPSRPGEAFCVYHVLRDVLASPDARVLAARSSEPLAVEGVALSSADGVLVLLANLTAADQEAVVGPLPGDRASVRMLDETTAEQAMREPEAYRDAAAEQHAVAAGELRLALRPYAVATIGLPAAGR